MNQRFLPICLITILLLACSPSPNSTTPEKSSSTVPSPALATATTKAVTADPGIPTTIPPTITSIAETATATNTTMPPTPTNPPALPTATNTPLPPTVIPTTIPVTGPTIAYFRSSTDYADPGDTIQLEWSTSNATDVAIDFYLAGDSLILADTVPVEPAGVYTYTISEFERSGQVKFMLTAVDDAGNNVSANVTVALSCLYTWFAPVLEQFGCPGDDVLISAAAEQHFEHGTMIWIGESSRIYVLFEDNASSTKWNVLEDTWQDGDPIEDPAIIPPPGFYQPRYGFGKVWRENLEVRQRLGWAVDEEAGFETRFQPEADYKYPSFYLLAIDGQIIVLEPERSGWHKMNPN